MTADDRTATQRTNSPAGRLRARSQRRGTVTVEVALTVPILFSLFTAGWEFSRMEMIRQFAGAATYEGARTAIVPGATAAEAKAAAEAVLAKANIAGATVTVSPATIVDTTPQVTVTASIPLAGNTYVVPFFFSGKTIVSSFTLQRELFGS